jgi:hypothetical protein
VSRPIEVAEFDAVAGVGTIMVGRFLVQMTKQEATEIVFKASHALATEGNLRMCFGEKVGGKLVAQMELILIGPEIERVRGLLVSRFGVGSNGAAKMGVVS